MSPPVKTHCIKPNGNALCRDTVFEESYLRIDGVAAFLQAHNEGHAHLCGACLARCRDRLKPGSSEQHRPITSWVKLRMLELGLTRHDVAEKTGLHAWTVQCVLNKTYKTPWAQTDTLARIVAALGGELHVTYQVAARRENQ